MTAVMARALTQQTVDQVVGAVAQAVPARILLRLEVTAALLFSMTSMARKRNTPPGAVAQRTPEPLDLVVEASEVKEAIREGRKAASTGRVQVAVAWVNAAQAQPVTAATAL